MGTDRAAYGASLVRLVIVRLGFRVGNRLLVRREDLLLEISQHCLHAADEHSADVLIQRTRVYKLCAHIRSSTLH